MGNLGLTDEDEEALVAFLKTLSDGLAPPGKQETLEWAKTGVIESQRRGMAL